MTAFKTLTDCSFRAALNHLQLRSFLLPHHPHGRFERVLPRSRTARSARGRSPANCRGFAATVSTGTPFESKSVASVWRENVRTPMLHAAQLEEDALCSIPAAPHRLPFRVTGAEVVQTGSRHDRERFNAAPFG